MRLHTDFFEKLHEKFPTITEDAVIGGFYKFLKDITIESNIEYPREIDISSVTGTAIKFTDSTGNVIGIIEPVKKENFNHGIQLRVDDQVLGLFISDEYIATAIAPTPVPLQEGGNPKSIVTLDSFKQLAIYTLEELGLSFTEDGFIEIDKGDNSLSSVGFVKQQLDALKQEIIGMIPTNEEIYKLSALPRGSIIIWTSKDIPNGWAICDGTNGTPDMRDKFIVGASNNRDINVIGGHATTSISLGGLEHYHGVGHNPRLRTDIDSGWGWNFSTNGLNDIHVALMPSSNANTKYYFKCYNDHQYEDHNWLCYVDTNNKMHNYDGNPVDSYYAANPATYDITNIITSGAFSGSMDNVTHWSNAGNLTKELSVKSEPPFYSVYYIMKITGSSTELYAVKRDTEPAEDSINAVTSDDTFTYCEDKFKELSDRIDAISDSLDNIPDYTALQKSIEVIKARLDKQYNGYESLVYCETMPSGAEPVTFTTTAGTEYPGYYLFTGLSEGNKINPDTTKKYAVYKCIEPSECFLQYTPGSGAGSDSWTINYTLGKFEFVRWENA